jgi:hypothetical protein
MTSSMNDMLTVAKNIVTAINDQSRQTLLIAGSQVSEGISTNRLIATGSGRVCVVSVLAAGSAVGNICDRADANAQPPEQVLFKIPQTIGVYRVDLPFNLGLAVFPGTGQSLTVSYSIGNIARGSQ